MQFVYFNPSLRIMLQDLDPSIRKYSDDVLRDGVKTTVTIQAVPAAVLSPDQTQVILNTGGELDPNTYALVLLHTGRIFVATQPNRYGFRTRAVSESTGSWERYEAFLSSRIHELENGACFQAWQSYFSWLHGMAGLPLGEVLAQFDVQAPLWKATFTRDGMKVA